MKVLHVYKTYLPDNFEGTARVIFEIVEGARAFGVESAVLSLSAMPEPATAAVAGHLSHRARQDVFVASTGLSVSVFPRFAALAREADLLHYHFPWPMADLLHLSVAAGKPAIITYHSDVVRQRLLGRLYAPLMHRFLGRVDRIVATSANYLATSLVLQRHRDKVDIIPIGIPDVAAPLPERLAGWRKRLDGPFLLFVGALRYYKGLPILLEAARRTRLPVVIAGAGEMAGELTRTCPPNVVLLGPVDEADKEALLALCTAFVFPSPLRSEAFGVSLLEAARAGKPMLTCEIGTGTSYVNVENLTGLVVPPAEVAALAAAMLRLWREPQLAAGFGRAARARFETLFTSARMVSSYVDCYRSVLARRAQR